MALPWTPQFDYGSATLLLTYPVTRWTPGARTEGRMVTSASGIITPVLLLRKYTLGLTLRFTEDEIDSVIDFISFGQSGEPFSWHPNALDDAVPETVDALLELPRVSTPVKPVRDSVFLSLFSLLITVSRQTAPWDLEYFRNPA